MQHANKAILAAVTAALASFVATVQGRTDIDTMRAVDWIIVILAAALAGLITYTVPNQPGPNDPGPNDPHPNQP